MLIQQFISFAESYGMQSAIFRVTPLAVYKREVLALKTCIILTVVRVNFRFIF